MYNTHTQTSYGPIKGKGSYLESRHQDSACTTDFIFPLERWVPMQPATIDPTLDQCTTYPSRLVDRGSVEYKVCPTLLRMARTGN